MPNAQAGEKRELNRKRREKIWELMSQGVWRPSEVVERLKAAGLGEIKRQNAHRIMKEIRAELAEERKEALLAEQDREYVLLTRQYEECIAAWERSKKPQKEMTTRKRGQQGTGDDNEVTLRESSGDPRHQDNARRILADIRRMFGLDAALKVKLSGDLNVDSTFRESREQKFAGWEPAELEELARMEARVKARTHGIDALDDLERVLLEPPPTFAARAEEKAAGPDAPASPPPSAPVVELTDEWPDCPEGEKLRGMADEGSDKAQARLFLEWLDRKQKGMGGEEEKAAFRDRWSEKIEWCLHVARQHGAKVVRGSGIDYKDAMTAGAVCQAETDEDARPSLKELGFDV